MATVTAYSHHDVVDASMMGVKMYIGEQISDLSDRKLNWLGLMGVEHVAVENRDGFENEDGTWDAEGLKKMLARLREFGIKVDALALNMPSRFMSFQRFPGIMRGSSGRDAEIETIEQNVRCAGEAGVPCLKYNLNMLGVPRTGRVQGRGDAQYSHFNLDEWVDNSLTEAGPMPAERVWESITYFVERVIPVAEQSGVRMACHPHDPPVRHDIGLRGIHRVLGSVDGLKRFLSLSPSQYHGLNFCQGTVAEMCVDPATEVLEAIRYFGGQKRLFMVHFRNIRGGYLNFDEVLPDEGDVDMLTAIRAYRQVAYDGMLAPDHVPQSQADPDGERMRSFCLGYTRALIQATEPR